MARGRKTCIVENCPAYAKQGLRVCGTHASINALQQEIDRLRAAHPEGAWRILRYPDMRRLFRLVSELDNRAQPITAASTQVVARSRGHNLDDGVVAVGDHRVIPGYAVSSYADSGRLGSALSKVKDAADRIEKISDPTRRKPEDPRPRCGSRKCPQPNRRQNVGQVYCGYCGREMRKAS